MSDTRSEQHQHKRQRTVQEPPTDRHRINGHALLVVEEWLPGPEPTAYDVTLGSERRHRTRYWRCRHCGQERTRPEEFTEPCTAEVSSPLADGGYSVEDPRTRRALTEDMDIEFHERGPVYRVEGASGRTYTVDIDAGTCTCPDFEHRGDRLDQGCKHLRRVDLAIRAGEVPGSDGTFHR